MAADEPDIALRDELQAVEKQLAEIRQTAMELRAQIGGRSYGPTDSAEMASAITAAEEQEAFAKLLEARREDIVRRLGTDSGRA